MNIVVIHYGPKITRGLQIMSEDNEYVYVFMLKKIFHSENCYHYESNHFESDKLFRKRKDNPLIKWYNGEEYIDYFGV